METGKASKTALGVAIRRAAHQLVDRPPVLDDPAVRSRYVDDRLAEFVARGGSQYVVLGAGLATFAYRNPYPGLRVFEVDFPATQQDKRAMLAEAAITVPGSLTFVPLDLEHHTLAEDLAAAGFDADRPAFFGWLGVIPNLPLEPFRATLCTIARLPADSGVGFDYALAPETLSTAGRTAFDALAGRVAAAGEPFQLFFTPEELERELRRAGFKRFEQLDYQQLNERYFRDRADGLKLSAVGLGMLATAWV